MRYGKGRILLCYQSRYWNVYDCLDGIETLLSERESLLDKPSEVIREFDQKKRALLKELAQTIRLFLSNTKELCNLYAEGEALQQKVIGIIAMLDFDGKIAKHINRLSEDNFPNFLRERDKSNSQ